MVAKDDLPDFPTPIIVTDNKGRTRWTVSIPHTSNFPLAINQYSDICAKCREVSAQVQALRSHKHSLPQTILTLSSSHEPEDRHFIDVREAERAGLLPGLAGQSSKLSKAVRHGNLIGESEDSFPEKPACQTSMTFVLESADAGMGKTMMMLWTAYGMAQNEGRAFFIDDSRWAYGKYTDIFQPPPLAGCRAPPLHEMLPCPRQARHLVVSSATAAEVFGGMLSPELSRPENSARRIMFNLARQGYDALFKLNNEDSEYVDNRVRDLTAKRVVPKSKGRQSGMAVGIHVRRGDRHPLEYQYRASYIPVNMYAEMARALLEDRYNQTGPNGGEDKAAKEHSFMVLASDDPMVYEYEEFSTAFRPQERIKLASKAAIQKANPNKQVMRKFVDETFGWEGGFFAPMFWNLGLASQSAENAAAKGPVPTKLSSPSAETVRLRSLVGRAYMMDLAVLADVSDVVICTVSAMGCRLLAVMMGWEDAMESNKWINIDGHYRWTGVSW